MNQLPLQTLKPSLSYKQKQYEKDRNRHRRTPTSRIRWQHRFLAQYQGTSGTIQETRASEVINNNKKNIQYETENRKQ